MRPAVIKSTLSLTLTLSLVPACLAQDVTFSKTRYSSPKHPKEAYVDFSVTDSKILIKNKKVSKKASTIDVDIPYTSIDAISYELATRHRVKEGALVPSDIAGPIVMATKTKSHWLGIEYHDGAAQQSIVVRLDKSEYQKIIAVLESKAGKRVAILDSKVSSLNPTAESKDMDEVVSFPMAQVMAALKPAMESQGCKVQEETATRIECKRSRGYSEQNGGGGESVTATLEAASEQTRLRISTGKGLLGWALKKELVDRHLPGNVEESAPSLALNRALYAKLASGRG